MPVDSLKYLKHGKRNPLLLSPRLNYLLFGTFFAGNVAVLLGLISAAGKQKEPLASIARAAEAAVRREPERAPTPIVEKRPAAMPEVRSPNSLRVSLPEGWEWKGCLAESNSVEILLSPSPPVHVP